MSEFKRSDFVAAAKDLINVMGLADDKGKALAVDAKANVASLQMQIKTYAEQIDLEVDTQDSFQAATIAVLAHCGFTGFSSGKEAIEEEAVEEGVEEETTAAVSAEDPETDEDWVEPEPKTLPELVAATKKLAELKELCNKHDEFKALRKKLTDFMGFGAQRELKTKMQDIVGVAEKVVKQKEKKPHNFAKPGVINMIMKLIIDSGKEGISKKEILESLIQLFPSRDPEGMKATIAIQVPGRISKEKFALEKTADKKWFKK